MCDAETETAADEVHYNTPLPFFQYGRGIKNGGLLDEHGLLHEHGLLGEKIWLHFFPPIIQAVTCVLL
jgi:hypothetical protein